MIMAGLLNENRLSVNLQNTRMNKSLTNENNLHCYQFKKKKSFEHFNHWHLPGTNDSIFPMHDVVIVVVLTGKLGQQSIRRHAQHYSNELVHYALFLGVQFPSEMLQNNVAVFHLMKLTER